MQKLRTCLDKVNVAGSVLNKTSTSTPTRLSERNGDEAKEPENGEECCEMMSSQHDTAVAHMSSE